MAGEGADRGTDEQLERDEARHGVAGQTEEQRRARRPADRPMPNANGLPGWTATRQRSIRPIFSNAELDDVVRPDRHAARHDDRIRAAGECGAQPGVDVLDPILGDPQRCGLATRGIDEGHASPGPLASGIPAGPSALAGR